MASSVKHRFRKSYFARLISWLAVHNFVDILAMALPRRLVPKNKNRVLFIKMDGVGDYIIWTASFELLKKQYPSDEFERVLISNERNRDLNESEPTFERKVFVDANSFASSPGYRLSILREIRDLDADIVLNPRTTRDFLWGDSIVRSSGAPIRIGYSGQNNLMSPLQNWISAKWYSELRPSLADGRHELVSNVEFFGGELNELRVPQRVEAPNEFERYIGMPSGDYAVMFVGAFTADKRWPIENFAAVAEMIASEHGFSIVLCGGPGEESLANDFGKHFDREFSNLIGKTSLRQLSAVLAEAKLTITNDTSAGHIAVAQRCPVVVITPGNHVGRYYPYPSEIRDIGVAQISVMHRMPCFGCGWNCIFTELAETEPKPCVADVSPIEVMAAARKLLGSSS